MNTNHLTIFQLSISDIWGPYRITNISGKIWSISFVDDHTRTTWIFLTKEKSEAYLIFKKFHSMIQNQFQDKVQVLKIDNAKEYFHNILGECLLDNGIVQQSSCIKPHNKMV